MAQRLRGQDSVQRKRDLLQQIWLPGRLMEGLFPPATTGNNGCSHSFSHRQPCPGLADSTALHGSGAKPNLTREEEEEEVETVSREEGIGSHQGESQCAQSVGV
ncbi:hypothetical protein NQZ68_002113 [Dissostichus eleginoides]|nr:hypothetical protein NQZ68_002113 [Dissostichus eleginoides]